MNPQTFAPGARLRRAGAALSLGLGALAWSGAAHADLFADNEARRAILQLRAQVAQLQQQQQSQQSQLQQVRNSMLDLSNQIEDLKNQIAQLRGRQDTSAQQLGTELAKLQASQQQLLQNLKPLLPVQVEINGQSYTVQPAEKTAYDKAMTDFRDGQFAAASTELQAFVSRYPGSAYLGEARYWLGNSLYGQQRYRDAVSQFQQLIDSDPQGQRVPEALLGLANCQLQLREFKAARVTLHRLIHDFPKTEAAQAARQRLARLH